MFKKMIFSSIFVLSSVICAGYVYLNSKINTLIEEIQKTFEKNKQELNNIFQLQRDGLEISVIIPSFNCQKQGWLLPKIVCQAPSISFDIQTNDWKNTLPALLKDTKVEITPSFQTLLNKEISLSYSTNIQYDKDLFIQILQPKRSEEQLNAELLFNAITPWLSNKIEAQEKIELKDNTFFVSSQANCANEIFKHHYQMQTQSQSEDKKKIPLDVFLQRYFSLKIDNQLKTVLTSFSLETTPNQKMAVKYITSFKSFQKLFNLPLEFIQPKTVAKDLDILSEVFLYSEITQLPYFKVFLKHIQNTLLIIANQNASTTLTITLKDSVTPFKSEALDAFGKALVSLEDNQISDISSLSNAFTAFVGALKEYDIRTSAKRQDSDSSPR